MLSALMNKLGLGDGSNNIEPDSRRKHIRLEGIRAEVELGQQSYRVRDWSPGGLLFDIQPDAHLNAGDRVMATLRFRFPHETVTMQQTIRVVRRGARGVAAEFAPLTPADRRVFDRVIDSHHAENFLASQSAA